MTKLLVLSDSHGARDAIKRILKRAENVDALFFLGDGLRDLEQALAFFPSAGLFRGRQLRFWRADPAEGLGRL